MPWVPAMCDGCGLAFEVDPTAGDVECDACEGPVYPVAGDVADGAGVVDVVAAELAAIEHREELLAGALMAFDAAGLGGLYEAVEVMDGATARECLFVAVVQLAEVGRLDELARWN